MLRIAGAELQPNPGETDVRIRVRLNPVVDHDVVIPAPVPVPPRTRGVKLFEADFWAAGFTDGCRGCELITCGSTQSKVHNPECRKRMEQHLAQSADGLRRLQNAIERREAGAVGGMAGESAPAAASSSAEVPDVRMDELPAAVLPAVTPQMPPMSSLPSTKIPSATNDEDVDMDLIEEAPEVLIMSVSYEHGVGEVYSPPRVVPISIKHGFKVVGP